MRDIDHGLDNIKSFFFSICWIVNSENEKRIRSLSPCRIYATAQKYILVGSADKRLNHCDFFQSTRIEA